MADESKTALAQRDAINAADAALDAELTGHLTDDQLKELQQDALPGVAVEQRKQFGRPPLTRPQIRARALAVQSLLFQGYSFASIARQMKVSRQTVWRMLNEGRKLGYLQKVEVPGIINRIDTECLDIAVDGLKHHLAKKDKDAIFKTLEGRGVLVSHQSVKSHGGGGAVPQFKIVIQQGDDGRVGVMGQMVGAPQPEDDET